MDLVWSLGTVGGNPARPGGALEWTDRAAEREAELSEQLSDAQTTENEAMGSGLARKAHDIERLLTDLRGIRPALDALVDVSRHVVNGAKLVTLWPVLCGFFNEWLLQPGEGPRAHVVLDERLSGMASDSACGSLAGEDALRIVEETIATTRVPIGGFGDPSVYVGTVREATGLRFRAVRVIGLAEGHLPAVSREDPVLPDVLREALRTTDAAAAGYWPPTAMDLALGDLHALDLVVRSAESRVALSAARLDTDRSQREPSSVILEAAAALGRPNRSTGEAGEIIPDAAALQ